MDLFRWLYESSITIGDYQLSWLELVGVFFGLASAILGMYRKMWTWPVGIVGNVLLFFVYITVTFDSADHRAPLFGQSGRQIFFIITSVYGWWRWRQVQRLNDRDASAPVIVPRWARARERVVLAVVMVIGVALVQWLFATIGAGWPAPRWYYWCDAWIFMGSMLATYAMARGWNEFWLIWIGVDLVGVPLLLHSGYLPTAVLYLFYAGFVIYGFVVWLRASRSEAPEIEPEDASAYA
ncbi:Mononucleotide transporter [Nostocoides japonicum T1-X7]|uniref:Mononucleotide transporter n=1 Tax=Nostocoides japonicum T1-X7 TaxID=1194083 RepID=A0A077M1S7_9MICO|nr:nicotinamide riboside transporter PnuC [Tetrasphaera japonica]CCH80263.1 Mononucleotide transporter [Tetrasphaera japonica T1-X7]